MKLQKAGESRGRFYKATKHLPTDLPQTGRHREEPFVARWRCERLEQRVRDVSWFPPSFFARLLPRLSSYSSTYTPLA